MRMGDVDTPLHSDLNSQLLLVVEACSSLLSDPEDQDVFNKIVSLAQRFISADAYALWRRPPAQDVWRVFSSAGLSPGFALEAGDSTQPLQATPRAFTNVYKEALLASRWDQYRAEGIQSMLTIPLRIHGNLHGTLVFYHRAPHVFGKDEVAVATALGNLASAALNISDLYAEQRRLRAATEESANRASFLAGAGAILASSLDVDRTLASIAELAVPTIADWCAVDLIAADGQVRRVAVKHVDPVKIALARQLNLKYPPRPGSLFYQCLESGESAFLSDLPDEVLRSGAEDQEHLEALLELGLKSFVFSPLVVHGKAFGILTMVTAESGRRFRAEDIPFINELAQRAAFAVHSARLHEEVSQSAARLRLAASAAKLGIFEWDVRKDEALCENQRMYEIFGRTSEEGPLGRREFFEKIVHPEDAERVAAILESAMHPGGHCHAICRMIRKDGAVRWLEFAGVFEQMPNAPSLRLISVVADITERRVAEEHLRESEERLRFALQSGNLGSWELDLGTSSATRSLEHDKIFGYQEAVPDWKYQRFLAHILPEDRDTVDREIQLAAEKKRDFNVESRIRRTDGEVRWIWVSGRYFQKPDGAARFIGVISDLTDRKRFEERLRETAKLESIGVLAGGVAHDFNNLLTGILGNASLVLDGVEVGHPMHGPLQEVVRAGERAAGLTRQLLAYSGRGKFVIQLIDLSALVAETITLIRKLIPPDVQLSLKLGSDLSPIEGDYAQVTQVAMNLIINGAEALGTGGGRLEVVTEEFELNEEELRNLAPLFEIPAGRYVCLSVIDTGCGMDEGTLSKIFDPFFTTKFTGRGLGLSAVLGIVRAHKGSIKVSSARAKGTTFKIFFPGAAGKVRAETNGLGSLRVQGRGTVLLVDDEEIIRKTLGKMLERMGYQVLTAENGRVAVDLFRQKSQEIDLVFLDMSMPVMGGEEAMGLLRQIRRDIKVILSTGFGESDSLREVQTLGVTASLQKPYTADQLRQIIQSIEKLN